MEKYCSCSLRIFRSFFLSPSSKLSSYFLFFILCYFLLLTFFFFFCPMCLLCTHDFYLFIYLFILGLYCNLFFLYMVNQITSPGWMHETSARAWCTGKTQRDRVEREVGGGIGMGNTCKSMADSCQCITKTTIIL